MPQAESYVRVEQFHIYTKDDIVEMILHWFNENHEDPNEHCPYDEGEYVYIYGGPVTADNAIREEFWDLEIVDEDLLEEVFEQIPNMYDDFSLIPDISWSDYTANDPACIFNEHIQDIAKLISVYNSDLELHQKYLSLLFSNAVTTFETFIADLLIQRLHEDDVSRNLFLESLNIKKDNKERLIGEYERYWTEIVELIYSITFSNPKKLKKHFSSILKIEVLDTNLKELQKIAEIRNNVMHRNGKDKTGKKVPVDESTIDWCISTIVSIVSDINYHDRIDEEPIEMIPEIDLDIDF